MWRSEKEKETEHLLMWVYYGVTILRRKGSFSKGYDCITGGQYELVRRYVLAFDRSCLFFFQLYLKTANSWQGLTTKQRASNSFKSKESQTFFFTTFRKKTQVQLEENPLLIAFYRDLVTRKSRNFLGEPSIKDVVPFRAKVRSSG